MKIEQNHVFTLLFDNFLTQLSTKKYIHKLKNHFPIIAKIKFATGKWVGTLTN